MTFSLWTLSATWALPILSSVLVRRQGRPSQARILAVLFAAASTVLAGWVFAKANLEHAFARTDVSWIPPLGPLRYHLAVDGLTAVLLPLTAALSLGALLALPRAQVDSTSAADVLFIAGCVQGVILSMDLGLLTLFWGLSLVPFWSALSSLPSRPLRRLFLATAWSHAMPLLCAATALAFAGAAAGLSAPLDLAGLTQLQKTHALPAWIGWLVLFSALSRMGIFPFHAWVPAAIERSSAPAVVVTLAAPLGSFLLARVALPLFPQLCGHATTALLPVAVLTAIYGALVASGQHDLRRMLGFFRVSQAGFVLAGMVPLNVPSISGALLHGMVLCVASSGLWLVAIALGARTGTTDMRKLGGLVRQAPQMATGFLLLSAAAVGFPATMGFVSEDLIVQGLLRGHLLAAALLLIVTAFNGITLFRVFKRTFLGAGAPQSQPLGTLEDLYPRERRVLVAMVLALLIGGFLPEPLLAVHQGVVEALERADAIPMPHQ